MNAALRSYRGVSQREKKMFKWRLPSNPLLDIALNHLTLDCTALDEAILSKSEIRNPKLNKPCPATAAPASRAIFPVPCSPAPGAPPQKLWSTGCE